MGRQPDIAAKSSEKTGTVTVKGTHPNGMIANELVQASPHFVAGFIGKSQGEDRVGCDALENQVGDTMRDNPRFSRAWSGKGEERAFDMENSLFLLFIQTLDNF